eukprot:CAMPEP_0119485316 /NCGR_PEP_ID=MMETSP1344-20130328/12063_1 /TAXON_ID=236787 /ORGANISM="Florenciella parvula, Strain CCMP2471" /LENGTH=36 /DNA_ID= /DNA_START= /DNA_END= /DNA_ORIENTATION=
MHHSTTALYFAGKSWAGMSVGSSVAGSDAAAQLRGP